METFFTLLITLLGISGVMADRDDLQLAEAYYKQGLSAEKAGDVDKAQRSFQAAVQLNPEHANARYKVGEMKIMAPKVKSRSREKQIGAVRLPEFRVEGASLRECVDLIARKIDKQTDGELAPNFIIEDPSSKLDGVAIDLSLKDIPVEAVLKYLNEQANTKVRFDPYAVVITAK